MKYLKTFESRDEMAFSMDDIVKIDKSPIFGSYGYEKYENDIFKVSGVENLYSDTDDLLWKITSLSNINLQLFLKTNQLRKATKEEIKQYKLDTKVNKYNL